MLRKFTLISASAFVASEGLAIIDAFVVSLWVIAATHISIASSRTVIIALLAILCYREAVPRPYHGEVLLGLGGV